MFNKLRGRLILLTLGGAIFSIVLVSIITNITLFKKFDVYMREEQEDRVEAVIDLIQNAYGTNGQWTEGDLENIENSPLIDNFDIEIRDEKGNLIFTHNMKSTMISMHNEMMNRMGHGMMGRNSSRMMGNNLRNDNYILEQYEIVVDDEKVGTVSVGQIGPFLVSEREIEFTKGINSSIFYGAIISVLFAILMGLYTSKIISKPIIKITEAANHIREGKLDTRIAVSNKIEELQALTSSINHLAQSLDEQQLLRKRLTSDISHELRTPLTILQSHIEAISDGIWEPTQDKLNICKTEVVRLIKLVEELKNLAEIEKHNLELNLQKYVLSEDLNQLVEGFYYQFEEKGIKINQTREKDVYIYGDQDKIRQVLINLLSNALKYSNSGDTVTIGLSKKHGQVEITIEDTGIGIESKDLPYIFERFYRSDLSRNRRTGGAGIGLSITKALIEAHGGNITVESQIGKGTKFRIILPQNKL